MFTLFGFTVGFGAAMVIFLIATLILKGLRKLFTKHGAANTATFAQAVVVIAGFYMLVCAFWPTILTFMLWRAAELSFGKDLGAPQTIWSLS